jgi:C4-dicarboxylate transporter, DctM subunit
MCGIQSRSPRFSRAAALNDRLVATAHAIASVALLALLANVALSVLGRLLIGASVPATIELVSNWWMVLIFYFGLAATHRRNQQIRITALIDMAGPPTARLATALVALYGIVAFGILGWYSIEAAQRSISISEQTFGVYPIPVWPVKAVIPVGFGLLVLQNLLDLATAARARPAVAEGAKTLPALAAVLLVLCLIVAAGSLLMAVALPLPRLTVGILCMVAMLATMFLGVPVGLAMVISGAIGVAAIAGPVAAASTLTRAPFHAAASWSLSVLPMFILMGLILWRTGITERVFEVFQRILGTLPGGLAVTTNFAGAALASASGSTAAISYALGRIAIPEMLKRGYQPSLATGVVCMAGIIGNLIPPSIVLIVYAGVAQTPVGPQLLASLVPGLIISFAYGLLILIRCKLDPRLAPPYEGPRVPPLEKILLLRHVWGIPLIVVLVLGSLYGGIATATEAGALGCLAAILVGYVETRRRGGLLRDLRLAFGEAVSSFAGIMLLFVGVDALNRMITLSGLAVAVSEWVAGLGLGPRELLFFLILVYLVLGTFMDTMAIILLTVPLFAATLSAAGIDMIWFGVFITIMAELAVVTPPLGILAFIVHRLAQDPAVNCGIPVSLTSVFRGCGWFVIVTLFCVVVFILFPELVLALPGRL